MGQGFGWQSHEQLDFLRVLEEENAWIAGDVLPLCQGLWGIHGVIAVDGDVLMAEFESEDVARTVLAQLRRNPESRPGW
jgi:hypothetical protein